MGRLKRLFTNLLLAGDGLGLILHDHEYDGHVVKAADENLLHPNIVMNILPAVLHTKDQVNSLSPTSDQDRISPYFISTISSRRVKRIKKISMRGLLVDPIPNSPN